MKILICSDTHLGHKNFKVDEREKDFEKAFTQIVDYAVSNADAVIHAGDLFDAGRPSIKTILFTIKELARLKEKDIPFFTIAGNHDISVDESFLNVLDRLNLIIHLSDRRYYSKNEGINIIKGELRKGVFASGLYGKESLLSDIMQLREIVFPEKPCFKVFIFHHIVSDINSPGVLIKKSVLPKGFDLYVSGHWHGRFETTVHGKKLLYPGSTENWDFREIIDKEEKGFFIYDTEKNSCEFVKLKIRASEVVSVNCSGMSTEDVVKTLISKIGGGDGKMLFFRLSGRLKSGAKSTINKQEVYDAAAKRGYFFCRVYDGELENPNEEQISVKTKSINEIESEFFKNKGFSGDEINMSITLLGILGGDYPSSEREKMIAEAVKQTEEALK